MEQVKISFEGNLDASEVILVNEKFGPEVQHELLFNAESRYVRTYHEHTSSSPSSRSLSGVAVSKLRIAPVQRWTRLRGSPSWPRFTSPSAYLSGRRKELQNVLELFSVLSAGT